ncbi:fumarylacetoacetate hydrolase family protein [Aneurinibacillus sp. Ricciae_BoGa-3]|uniref:fumarylacetoacetate hydrolase family protein n=1 Tax=Aneurinibacillus sp. Ricciae_BoGa-3 TaxID=3022697 RepID=UPI002341F0BE|nr:fumarylacetoacetate hydrolase family protein [Aneurinibacillus sp. Ricciae_BoGa-3]WCK54573.1 fumarylacetoacetate hydrolase family protein [Aneurinibacillus sp. Ricciae_BoGa-3]
MKLLHIKKGDQLTLGVLRENGVIDIQKAASEWDQVFPSTIDDLIESGKEGIENFERAVDQMVSSGNPGLFIEPDTIEFGPCVQTPEKIICVGLNYINHAEESKMDIPTSPILFSKFNNALTGHKQIVSLPADAEKFDYEAELAIVIGKTASNVTEEEALDYVFGYTTGNDLSARDLQFRTGQWLLGKNCDGFAPIGPYLVTADEIGDPGQLEIKCKVNGELRQSANTKDMIFDCATIVSYISRYMTLKPGDVIFSGTPDGVILGYPESQQQWLKSGDEIAVSIEKIGTLVTVLD